MRTRRTRRSYARKYSLTSGACRYALEQRDGTILQTFHNFYDLLDTAESGACGMPERSSRRITHDNFNDAPTFRWRSNERSEGGRRTPPASAISQRH